VQGKIRIGNQTAFTAPTATRPFEYAVANGFNAFEWFPDKKDSGAGWDLDSLNSDARSYIRHTARTFDIAMSVHAPWEANPLSPRGLHSIGKCVEFAKDIGAGLLNIHLYTGEGVESFARALEPVLRLTREAGLKLSIENTPYTGPQEFNRLFEILWNTGGVPTGHAGMCFDAGHANLHDITLNNYVRYMDALAPGVPVIHVHLHENYGDGDTHMTLFTGPSKQDASGVLTLLRRLDARGYSGLFILEQWPEPPSLLNHARDTLFHLIHSERLSSAAEPLLRAVAAAPKPGEAIRFLDALVSADREASSWREKLLRVLALLSDTEFFPSRENLVYLATYLRFLGEGRIACAEDGRHMRPGNHANLARLIEELLTEVAAPEDAFILRKIHPWLPSYDEAFTRREPLSRIRDIAHRGDIPGELKKEIKHTLQNKLHRCAGPEDLATSRALLKRISAPGAAYPPSFVEEFRTFHQELEEFFNASSLEGLLAAIVRDGTAPRRATLIERFLKAKEDVPDEAGSLRGVLALLAELRKGFAEDIEEAGKTPGAQRLRLADIGLENFAFVLLSRAVNLLGRTAAGSLEWKAAMDFLALALWNIRMSGLYPDECGAMLNELEAQRRTFGATGREEMLRFKATLERCMRLSETYADLALQLFPERAARLGLALGLDEEAIRLFAEEDIRESLVFQLSKLASATLKRARSLLGLPSWEPVVEGKALGRVVAAEELSRAPSGDGAFIVLLENAEGDEHIPEGVAGIVLRHGLPHLCHLGVQARQKGAAVAVCEDGTAFLELEGLAGRQAVLEVSPESATLSVSEGREEAAPETRAAVKVPPVDMSFMRRLMRLDEVSFSTAGGKADAMRRLEALAFSSRGTAAAFKTPAGAAIPFGVMEESLLLMPGHADEYRFLMGLLEDAAPEHFEGVLQSLRAITGLLNVPGDVMEGLRERFPPGTRFMVRSSSNCEDLEGFSGAGLHESVANVSHGEIPDAVRKVWSSLWTEKAARERKQARIPHREAHMAVLIQTMLIPELSFIMHTANPLGGRREEAYIELAAGLGETLASGIGRGTPFRLLCNKVTGEVRALAFASIDSALVPDGRGGISRRTVDYSAMPISASPAARQALGSRIAAIGALVEGSFGQPQDIEGAVVGENIYLVQSRPQQGLA